MRNPRRPIEDRLARRRQVTDAGCWLWTGRKNNMGYGNMTLTPIAGRGQVRLVHRIAYEHFVGPIPQGMQLDHLCRVRSCFNPEHLEPVTSQANTLRGAGPTAVNAAKTQCVHGHEFTQDNTYLRPGGQRECRTCRRQSRPASRERVSS